MKKKAIALLQISLLLSILSVILGYSAVNSDLCKYIRVFELVENNNAENFVYLNAVNLAFVNLLAILFGSTESKIITYGLLCALFYFITVTILVKRDVKLPIYNLSKFFWVAAILIVNPLSSNLSGLFRSYIASLLLVLGFSISNTIQILILLILSVSLQPLTVIPALLVNYASRAGSPGISTFKIFNLNVGLICDRATMCAIPFFITYKILKKDFSYPELMLYFFIFSGLLVSQDAQLGRQQISMSTQLFKRSASTITMIAMVATLLRVSPDAYRILLPLSVLATSSLVIYVMNTSFNVSHPNKTLLTFAVVFCIFITPLYIFNFAKVFAVSDDVLCSQLDDPLIKIIPSSSILK